jgi:hypothetical protein
LIRYGPPGWLALAAAAVIVTRPALAAAAPQLPAAAQAARDLYQALTFRLQWRWRIPATRRLAGTIPQLATLGPHQLGVLAGQLHRTRAHSAPLGHLGGYGMVHTGVLAATAPTGDPITLTRGATWHPGHHLHHPTSRRAILITIGSAAIDQLLTPSAAPTAQPCAP